MEPAVPTWSIRPPAAPEALARLGPLPPLAAQVLLNRGLEEAAAVAEFLQPDYGRLGDPLQMKGLAAAAERIGRALQAGEPIAIYGDFDADGVTAATLLVQALRHLGGQVACYIPHRIEEGYGLNSEAVERLAAQGTRLLITVDCGISNAAEVQRANELGMEVIVTDHHLPPAELPPALAILNPRQDGCGYPYKHLAGVGIAFTLVRGLARAGAVASRHGLRGRDLLDLVALGTVADVAPLAGENRILVAYGLQALREARRPGVRALLAATGVAPAAVDAGTIGFVLGPRLNAAGRLQDARTAYQLLQAETQEEAAALAQELDCLNRERQELTAQVLARAREQVLDLPQEHKLIILADADFPAGVVGLVAGKIVEEFYRPTLLLEVGETESRGSARSIEAFDVTAALRACSDLLTRFGGHRMAAGFTVPNENLPALQERLHALAEAQLEPADLSPTLRLDAEAALSDLNWDLVRILEQMAPFGVENPRPVFFCPRLQVKKSRRMGKEGAHLRLTVSDGRRSQEAVAWRMGERAGKCPPGALIDLAGTLDINTWNGQERLELVVRDLRPAG